MISKKSTLTLLKSCLRMSPTWSLKGFVRSLSFKAKSVVNVQAEDVRVLYHKCGVRDVDVYLVYWVGYWQGRISCQAFFYFFVNVNVWEMMF